MFCTNCGQAATDSAQFCSACGTQTTGEKRAVASSQPSPQRALFEQPDIGVPHCETFSRTADGGFTVSFTRTSDSLQIALVGFLTVSLIAFIFSFFPSPSEGGPFWGGRISAALMWVVGIGLVAYSAKAAGKPTRTLITVTPSAVIIGERVLSRDHFQSFGTDEKFLKYTYGMRVFRIGLEWQKEQNTEEVARALNYHLHRTPTGTATHQPPPQVLREVRPTDF